jgi:hypothetical protein
MSERDAILTGLAPLFERADREGLMFHCSYQDLWFTPAELRKAHAEGRFLWGAVNWTLRSRQEREEQLQRAVYRAEDALRAFHER